jgi:hypothetical protein
MPGVYVSCFRHSMHCFLLVALLFADRGKPQSYQDGPGGSGQAGGLLTLHFVQ